ncbi:MAG TPA: acyclic terpene utilization AtuA family protein, partial [Candidatus Elarobacter sp.]|nr:acyclic terpene utilization AtuA family protein [Candidatus Elarobacter sp.]
MSEAVVIVPVGALGAGVRAADVRRGIALGAHAIAADAGSTDSGPFYLASGISKYSREAVAHDLRVLMAVREEARIPLLIGSCGTSGCDDAVDWTLEIALDIARELGQSPKIAVLYSEQRAERIASMNVNGAVSPLAPSGALTAEAIDSCTHIVAVMGPEPYIDALRAGADIVLGGRTTDTAVLAAVPLMRGAGAAPAWHAGKVAECGGQCTVDPTDGGVLIRVRAEDFDVEPLSVRNRCDPHSVSAHMLYENSDPYRLIEPGGVLDVIDADYVALDDRVVRVTGSRFAPAPYTMKLEGAAPGPFQTIMFIGIADPAVLASIDLFVERLSAALYDRVRDTLGEGAGEFDISLRAYGWNAVLGRPLPRGTTPPPEVGIMFVATAASQAIATRIAKACNSHFFHFPLRRDVELPSYAFPFSPAEIERGQVFEFRINHVVRVED